MSRRRADWRGGMSRRIAPKDAGFSEPGEGAGHTRRNTEPWNTADSRTTMSVQSGNISDYTAGYHVGYNPIYQSQWDAEFRQHSYSPWPMRTFAILGVVWHLVMFGKGFASAHGGFDRALEVFAPRVLGSIFLSLQ
jgi:hypothetical protein